MDTVLDLLHLKDRRVVVTSAAATVRQATRLMNDHAIGSLLVTAGSRLTGIFTERDVLRRVDAEGRSPDSTTVGEVMTGDVNAHRFASCATELVQVREYIMGRG
jgi:CBS domain-containing protein